MLVTRCALAVRRSLPARRGPLFGLRVDLVASGRGCLPIRCPVRSILGSLIAVQGPLVRAHFGAAAVGCGVVAVICPVLSVRGGLSSVEGPASLLPIESVSIRR